MMTADPAVSHQPFGDIQSQGETGIYTAASDWQRISTFWRIKTYPIHPISGEPLEKPSVGRDEQDLLPPNWETFTIAVAG